MLEISPELKRAFLSAARTIEARMATGGFLPRQSEGNLGEHLLPRFGFSFVQKRPDDGESERAVTEWIARNPENKDEASLAANLFVMAMSTLGYRPREEYSRLMPKLKMTLEERFDLGDAPRAPDTEPPSRAFH